MVDGSSTVFPLAEAVAEEFMRDHPRVRVTVGASGTGGGFAKFARGETDLSNASRPVKPEEGEAARAGGYGLIELPIAYDGLAVVAHPETDWVDCLTLAELRRIWEPDSDADSWADVRAGFPDAELRLYGPGTGSGTYDYFTATVVGAEGASRTDFTASEDDNVLVQGVGGDEGALGFFGLAYYEENAERLKLLAVDGGDGCVRPSPETVQGGAYHPLARPEFVYVRADRAGDPAVDAFVRYFLEFAAPLAREVGAVPLSDAGYALARARFDRRIAGSVFYGVTGARVDDVLAAAMPAAADSLRAAPASAAPAPPAVAPPVVPRPR